MGRILNRRCVGLGVFSEYGGGPFDDGGVNSDERRFDGKSRLVETRRLARLNSGVLDVENGRNDARRSVGVVGKILIDGSTCCCCCG